MNIQPIGITTQSNCRNNNSNQNIAFGGYTTSITKEEIKDAIREAQFMEELDLGRLTAQLLANLEKLKKKWSASEVVDVHTFLAGSQVWGLVKPSAEITRKKPAGGFGECEQELICESIVYGERLVDAIEKQAQVLVTRYIHWLSS